MLHIILGILKIIGFLLLSIFLLLLVLLLTVLFVPIRYQAMGDLHEDVCIEGKITWLLHLVSVMVAFRDKHLGYSVKIFGISLLDSSGKEKSDENFSRQMDTEDDWDDEIEPETVMNEDTSEEPLVVKTTVKEPVKTAVEERTDTQTVKRSEDFQKRRTSIPEDVHRVSEDSQGASRRNRRTLSEKAEALIRKIKVVFAEIKEKIKNIQQTIESIKNKMETIKRFLYAKSTKNALDHGKRELLYLLRHIRPRKLEGNLRFGLDDPGSTGQVIGYLSILQGLTGNHLVVEGVFDRKVTEGTVFMSGHIRLCHFVKILFSMILDRNVRITVKKLLKMRK